MNREDEEVEESCVSSTTHRVTAAAWLAGISAVVGFACLAEDTNVSVGKGIAVASLSAMVVGVCYFILRSK
ncbi:MAG: hypothetical protein AB1705_00760 [Verrucomicrobiota bacterium]